MANSRALVQLSESDSDLGGLLNRVAAHPAGNRALTEVIVGLDTCYEPGGHPWLGRLAPDVPLTTGDGETSLATLLHPGHPVLLDLTSDRTFSAWAPVLRTVFAGCPSHPDIRAVLLRPDGHTAWLSTSNEAGLAEAVHRWIGDVPAPVAN